MFIELKVVMYTLLQCYIIILTNTHTHTHTHTRLIMQVTFQVSQAITDVPRECIQYWVVVIPVVIGIFSLTVIIAVLGFVSHMITYDASITWLPLE